MNLDEELRAALRREAPRVDLAPKVLARLRARTAGNQGRGTGWLRWAVVVVVVLAVAGVFSWQRQVRRQHARAAAQQLSSALRLAANELNAVRARVVRTP